MKNRGFLSIKGWIGLLGVLLCASGMAQEKRLEKEEPIAPKIGDFSADRFGARKERVRHDVRVLASDDMEGRLTGSVQDSLSALYIGKEFLQNGLLPFSKEWKNARSGQSQTDYWHSYSFKARWGEQVRSRNVIGLVRGTDSVLAGHFVIVGAHFDHLGWGDKVETSMRKGVHEIHNGADDNASGVAVMLELMRYYSQFPLRKSLIFVAFSGEEIGLCGSQAFLNDFPFELSCIDAMFNLDMLGNLQGDEFRITGTGTSKEAVAMVKEADRRTDLRLTMSPDGHGPSDHASFYARQIPVFFFCTPPSPTYHTPDDDAATLNYDGMVRLSSVIGDLLRQTGDCAPLHFTSSGEPSSDRNMGMGKMKVKLGLMPDINNTARKGLTAMIVVEGKAAYRAGLRNGDVILRLNGKKVSSVEQYMEVLSALQPGEEVKIKALRKSDAKKTVYTAKP